MAVLIVSTSNYAVTVIAFLMEYGSSNIAVDPPPQKKSLSATSNIILIILSHYIKIEFVFLLLIF
jgi:hypothetical protein